MVDETTTTPGGTEETIPEEIKNVFALRGKNVGCSVKLRGRVVLIAFLINDGGSRWDRESEEVLVSSLKQVSANLMHTSGLNRDELDIAYAYCQVTVPYTVGKHNSSRFVQDVLRQFGYEDIQSYQKHYESKFHRDEACVSFVFNKSFRSYAVSVKAAEVTHREGPGGNEYSIVAFNPKDPQKSQRTFIHELMHQFGAVDYYYPERLAIEAEHYFPGSIMNSGETIDDVTRYVIGWTDSLTPQAKAFLKAISKIPQAEIDCAGRDQWLD